MRLFRRPPAPPRRGEPRASGRESRPNSRPVDESYDERLRSPIKASLDGNLSVLKDTLLDSDDMVVRRLKVGAKGETAAALLFAENLVDSALVESGVLRPILLGLHQVDVPQTAARRWPELLQEAGLTAPQVSEVFTLADVVEAVLSGEAVMLLDGRRDGLAVRVTKYPTRNISEPPSERLIKGARVGFVETLGTNIAMIRSRVKDSNLKVRVVPIGARSRTNVALVYLANLANPELVDEARSRLDSIKVDRIFGAGQLEHLFIDAWTSFFPLTETTERLDRTGLALMEGRIVVLVDGTPFVVIIPATLNYMMISPEDYNQYWLPASALRLFRVLGTTLSLLLPPFYIALTSFHPEMFPIKLLISIGTARLKTPFPAIVEALGMEIAIEIIREAGLRLPSPLGQTIGVVGGIVVGQAAIQASLVSPLLLIVVALTTISSFTIPTYDLAAAIRFLRFPMMLMAASFGLYGILIGLSVVLVHLVTLKSFGAYYLAPFAPQRLQEMKDSVIRLPAVFLKKRPQTFAPLDRTRVSDKRDEVIGPKEGEWHG